MAFAHTSFLRPLRQPSSQAFPRYVSAPLSESARLMAVERVKHLPRPRQSTTAKSHQCASGSKAAIKCSYANKPAQLMNMPIEIFLEIATYLLPIDIVHLSRVSWRLNLMLTSRTSRIIWQKSLNNIYGLPPCPPDLSELRYARLVFEKMCDACGSVRAHHVDFFLRLRLCKECYANNMSQGFKILQAYKPVQLSRIIYSLLPQANCPFITRSVQLNHHSGLYYRPELESVIEQYIALREDSAVLDQFVRDRQEMTNMLLQHGTAVHIWEATCRQQERAEISWDRYLRITQKMRELGWEEQYFPNPSDELRLVKQWRNILLHPRPFSERIWATIRPKLEGICLEVRQSRIRRAYQQTLFSRLRSSLLTRFPEERASRMFSYAPQNPTLLRMLATQEEIPQYDEAWNTIVDAVVAQAQHDMQDTQDEL